MSDAVRTLLPSTGGTSNAATRLCAMLFDSDAEITARFLRDVLQFCAPVVFASQQLLFYRTLCELDAFVAPEMGKETIRVRYFGPDYSASHSIEYEYYAARFLCALAELLVDTRLYGTLTQLAQLPLPVARALLFAQRPNSDGFFLRQWMARRFFVEPCEEVSSWIDESLRLLQTPEYFDLVWLRFAEDCDALGGDSSSIQRTDTVIMGEYRASLISSCTVDTSIAVIERCCEQTTPRVLLTFYIHFMHRMAELMRHGLDLFQNFDEARPFFEACLAMLLGITDATAIQALSQLSVPMLHHLSRIAEEMRTFLCTPLAGRTNTVAPLLLSLYMRTMGFDSVFVAMMYANCAATEHSRPLLVEPTYAPLRELEFERFFNECFTSAQVVQLTRIRKCLPALATADFTALGESYGVWRLPENARIYRVEQSIEFYRGICAELLPAGAVSKPFVGSDSRGPFVIAPRETMHLLQVAALLYTMRYRSCKSVAIHPILAHLYMLDSVHASADAVLFARNAFVHILAHWLLIERDGMTGSVGVPLMRHGSIASDLLCKTHMAVNAIWNGIEINSRAVSAFCERLTALRDFLTMSEPHWISLALLQELDDACVNNRASVRGDSAALVHAIRVLMEMHNTVNNDPVLLAEEDDTAAAIPDKISAGRKRDGLSANASRKRRDPYTLALHLPNGESLLEIRAGADLLRVYSLLSSEHLFVRSCFDYTERMLALNEAVYDCALHLWPTLVDQTATLSSLCSRVLQSMRTSRDALTATSYRRSAYASFKDGEDRWTEYVTASECSSGPRSAQYCIRPDISRERDAAPLVALLQQLELVVCLVKTRSMTPYKCESDAIALLKCLFDASSSSSSSIQCMDSVVASYYDSDANSERLVAFDLSLGLVDLPHSTVAAGVTTTLATQQVDSARQRRRSFGRRSVTVSDRGVNVVSAEFEAYTTHNPARLSLTEETLTAVLAYKSSSDEANGITEKQ